MNKKSSTEFLSVYYGRICKESELTSQSEKLSLVNAKS